MEKRIEAELALLERHYSAVEYLETSESHWFKIETMRTAPDWSSETAAVVFSVTRGYPGAGPYGFYVPAELTYAGHPPDEQSAEYQPPFPGNWRFLSWTLENWQPTADLSTGSNLWGWVRSFVKRFEEGK